MKVAVASRDTLFNEERASRYHLNQASFIIQGRTTNRRTAGAFQEYYHHAPNCPTIHCVDWLIDCLTARQHRKVNGCQLRRRETGSVG